MKTLHIFTGTIVAGLLAMVVGFALYFNSFYSNVLLSVLSLLILFFYTFHVTDGKKRKAVEDSFIFIFGTGITMVIAMISARIIVQYAPFPNPAYNNTTNPYVNTINPHVAQNITGGPVGIVFGLMMFSFVVSLGLAITLYDTSSSHWRFLSGKAYSSIIYALVIFIVLMVWEFGGITFSLINYMFLLSALLLATGLECLIILPWTPIKSEELEV